jgi:hypothetical protein
MHRDNLADVPWAVRPQLYTRHETNPCTGPRSAMTQRTEATSCNPVYGYTA